MKAIDWAEAGRLPDALVRLGIRRLCQQRLTEETLRSPNQQHERYKDMLDSLRNSPIALHTDAANEQHYEIPPAFYELTLGRFGKYSSGYWPAGVDNLDAAEQAMLEATCEHAALSDQQDILELGCGWGSLTLFMAARYPNARITAISNSGSQREHILAKAAERKLENIEVITVDVNEFDIDENRFDRVVSVEMFEHVRNYQTLLGNIHRWLKPDGELFVHIFCHRELMYPFEVRDESDWMSKYFFTGGLMPSANTLLHFQQHLVLDDSWHFSGQHYEKTANAWLDNLDANREAVHKVLAGVYGEDKAKVWVQRWRIFFMSCAELFGYKDGHEWLVCHYRFRNRD